MQVVGEQSRYKYSRKYTYMVLQTYNRSYNDTWRSRTPSRAKNGIKDGQAN